MSIERKSSERNNVRHRSRKRETTKENKFGHDNDQISIKMIIEFHLCLRNFKLHRSHTSGNPKTTHLRRDNKRLKLLKIHFHWLHLEPLISQAKS